MTIYDPIDYGIYSNMLSLRFISLSILSAVDVFLRYLVSKKICGKFNQLHNR